MKEGNMFSDEKFDPDNFDQIKAMFFDHFNITT